MEKQAASRAANVNRSREAIEKMQCLLLFKTDKQS